MMDPRPWELGALEPAPEVDRLIPVADLGDVVEITASREHYCAAAGVEEPQLWCWGINEYGEVGRSNADGVPSLTGVTSVSQAATRLGLGKSTSCAVDEGTIQCWGESLDFAGMPSHEPLDQTPSGIEGEILEVGVGDHHACVLTDQQQVWCWSDDVGDSAVNGHGGEAWTVGMVDLGCP